ncbi:TolC family protein [Bacteroidota bacterium]
MKGSILITLFVLFTGTISAQTNILDGYVQEGLKSNLAIKQNQMALESAQYALKVAKGMYLPSVSAQSRYSFAKGGRTIDFPIADLMNPVYSTLNDMIEEQGGTAQFPMVENEQINFLREQEYEAKISITQPIYYPSIAINKKIEQQKLFMSEIELEQYKRELTFQIKEAYYNYMKAMQYYDLIQKTKEVVNENHRVTKKLMENDMVTLDAVLRAKSEISKIELYETDAIKNTEMSKSYFNFLLNRDLNEDIIVSSQANIFANPEQEQLTQNALSQRQELQLLDHQIKIMNNVANLSKAEMLPNLVFAIDYGIQGEELTIDNESDFIIGSFVLTWDLFSGNAKRNKKKQAIIEKQKVEYRKEEVGNQIKLEVKQDIYEVDQQVKNLKLAETRSSEASEVYRIIEKRYRLGEAQLIELLDARNNMTEAESQVILTKYDYLVSIARLEKSSIKSLAL